MNQREKVLAATVGMLLLVVVSYYAFSFVNSVFTTRQDQITTLQKQITGKKRIVRKGVAASRKMKMYQERSLPPRNELARSLYSEWLLKLVNDAGFEDAKVSTITGRKRKDIYTLFIFTVNGRGDLNQLTNFLHEYYSADHLHRIQRLNVKPIKDSNNLALSISIEALLIPSSPKRNTLSTNKSDRLQFATLAEYTKPILERNFFSPPNQPPLLASISSQQAYLNKSFSLSIKAEEFDHSDKLEFELDENAPPGVSLRPAGDRDAELTWTPGKLGEYEMTIFVSDNGLPSKGDMQTIQIRVIEAPPETVISEPLFDVTKHTYLIAIIGINRKPMIWLHDRTTSTTHKLLQGQKFQIGRVQGVVRRIGQNQAGLESEGRVITISRGENLNQAIQRAVPAEENISSTLKTPM